MKDKIANLINLKSIVTIIITFVLSYMAVTGKVDAKDYFAICLMVFGFYFSRKDK